MLQGRNRRRPNGLRAARLSALFAAGWLGFSFPLLAVFEGNGGWWGLPRLPVALFAGWILLIAVLAWLVERDDGEGP